MNGLAGHHFLHQYPRGGENNMPAHRPDMRLFKEVLRLKFTAGLSHRQIAAALGIGTVRNPYRPRSYFREGAYCVKVESRRNPGRAFSNNREEK